MAEEQPAPPPLPPPQNPPSLALQSGPAPASPQFDPSRMIGIIRRKALIKDLTAVYHAECMAYGREFLEFQRRWEETYKEFKSLEDSRRDMQRPPKRAKKVR